MQVPKQNRRCPQLLNTEIELRIKRLVLIVIIIAMVFEIRGKKLVSQGIKFVKITFIKV